MSKHALRFAVAVAAMGCTVLGSSSSLMAQTPRGVKTIKDINYAASKSKAQTLDLYLPASRSPLPVIVFIHGGAWTSGTKNNCPAVGLTARGYAVVSVEYRLVQEAPYPAQIEDCKAAIRFLRAKAKDYNLDADHIGVWGQSAGGHLVALLGTSGDVKEIEGKVGENLNFSSRVQAVCDWYGPSDLTAMMPQSSVADAAIGRLLGGTLQQKHDLAVHASPVTYVTKDDPPFLIMHGDQDRTVPLSQSQKLHDVLKKSGVDSTLLVVKGAGHGFKGPQITKAVADFFDRNLKQRSVTQPASKPAVAAVRTAD